jgi:hypothetical protein
VTPSLKDVLAQAARLQAAVPGAVLVGGSAAALHAHHRESLNRRPEAVATQLVRQLADPRPRDAEVTTQLTTYKALDPRWQEWSTVKATLADLAQRMAR